MSDFNQNLLVSSIANFIFVCVFAIGAWLRTRLAKSNCKIDCGIFECDSSIIEIQQMKRDMETHTETQRGMLKDILVILDSKPGHVPSTD